MRAAFSSIFSRAAIGTTLAALAAMTVFLGGCTPDNNSESLGPLPKASFTIAPLSGKVNTFVASAGTSGVFGWYWNKGDGSGNAEGGSTDTLFFPLAGNYRVVLTALGHGGYDTASQIVQVASNAPLVNSLGNQSLTTDSGWTTLNVGGTQTTINFTPQGLNLSNAQGSSTNGAIYQAVAVKAGVQYTFSASVTTTGSTSQSWIEFYFGTTVPNPGSDYTDNKLWSLNTYSGCGTTPGTVNVAASSCAGTGANGGQVTFPKNETIYVVIKAGSYQGFLGTGGVTITNVILGSEP